MKMIKNPEKRFQIFQVSGRESFYPYVFCVSAIV